MGGRWGRVLIVWATHPSGPLSGWLPASHSAKWRTHTQLAGTVLPGAETDEGLTLRMTMREFLECLVSIPGEEMAELTLFWRTHDEGLQ